jgi:transcriptional regulator with XRE-family HTH domain
MRPRHTPLSPTTAALGRRVRFLREEKGWSQAVLGAAIGQDRSWVSKLEHGLVDARFLVLEALAEVLDVSVSTLMEPAGPCPRVPSREGLLPCLPLLALPP